MFRTLVARDIQGKYRGTALGLSWVVIHPLLMLAVYAFVFGGIFNVRWRGQGNIVDFVQMLYCGLVVYGVFSDTISRAPGAVLANPNYVKKIVFPLELLPLSHLATSTVHALISIGLLCLFLIVQKHHLAATALLIPVVLTPLLIFTAGVAWLLAAVGVFLRDINQVIGVAMSVLLFLSPIFYPVSSVPSMARPLIYLNPLTYPIEALRQVLILGTPPNWLHWVAYAGAATIVALAGMWLFQRFRPAFADVV